jgi:serine/threonine protein kinase
VHSHVLAIHSVDATGRLPFLVMPYVDGESLQDRVRRNGPLGTKEVLRIGVQAARGLQAAHEQGLVHRDIKPVNILLERDVDRAMLTDFGLARAVDDASMTRSGVIAGTPQFMSPEQARGEAVDLRSDLFSLGSVFYTMCAGRPPFRAETTMGLLRRIIDVCPRPLREVNADIPEWLAAIIEKLHAKTANDRFESAGELADLLEGCLAHVQQPTRTPLPKSIPRQSREQLRSARRTVGLAAALVVVAMFAIASPYGLAWLAESPQTSGAPTTDVREIPSPGETGVSLDGVEPTASLLPPTQTSAIPPTQTTGIDPVALTSDAAGDSGIDQDLGEVARRIDVLDRQLTVQSDGEPASDSYTRADHAGPSPTDSVQE